MFSDQFLDGPAHLPAGAHPSAWKSSKTGASTASLDGAFVAVSRASSRVARVIRQGLLSLGNAHGRPQECRRAWAGPARCHAPRDEARNDPLAGPSDARRAGGPSTRRRARVWPRRVRVDGPRPRGRTCSPKEVDEVRDDRRRAGDRGPRPFLGRRASRCGPRDTSSWRVASRRSSLPLIGAQHRYNRRARRPPNGPATVPWRRRAPSWPLDHPSLRPGVCEIPRGSRSPR